MHFSDTQSFQPGPRSEISFNLSEAGDDRHQETAEKELMHMGLQIQQPQPMDANTRKIESKDSLWKPAPIMGHQPQYQQPQMTATQQLQRLREQAMQQQPTEQ